MALSGEDADCTPYTYRNIFQYWKFILGELQCTDIIREAPYATTDPTWARILTDSEKRTDVDR